MHKSNPYAVRFDHLPMSFFSGFNPKDEGELDLLEADGTVYGELALARWAVAKFIALACQNIDRSEYLAMAAGASMGMLRMVVAFACEAQAEADRSNEWRVDFVIRHFETGTLVLEWRRQFTGGRYFRVVIDGDGDTMVRWDTGTGRESTYMGLPSQLNANPDIWWHTELCGGHWHAGKVPLMDPRWEPLKALQVS